MTDEPVGSTSSPDSDDEDQPPPRPSLPHAAAGQRRNLHAVALLPLLEVPAGLELPVDPGWMLFLGLFFTLVASLVVHALQKFSPSLILLRQQGARKTGRQAGATGSDGEFVKELQESEIYLPAAVLVELLGITAAALGAIALVGGATAWPAGWPGIVLFVLLVGLLARLLPERITEYRAERIVLFALPALRVLRILLIPLTLPMVLVTQFCIRNVLGIREEVELEQEREQLADEIRAAVEDSDDSEELADEEKAWIENIVEFRKEDAAGIMTPRTDMVCIEAGSTLKEAMSIGVEAGHSRLPVFEGKLDAIIGVFYLRDAVAVLTNASPEVMEEPVRAHTRQAYFVPESKRVSDLLREFREMRVQIAVVVDEYGGTSGLVSIEDILEEIVGEIQDEYDPQLTEEPFVVQENGHWAECEAKTRIGDLNEQLAVELPESEDYETLGGFVSSQLGRIGITGEVFHWSNVEFTILIADARRVLRVRIRVLEPEAQAG